MERWAGVDHVVTLSRRVTDLPCSLSLAFVLVAGICTSVCPKTAYSTFLEQSFSDNPPLCAFWALGNFACLGGNWEI